MGVNIHIQTTKGEKHPDWDSFRYGGDKEFASNFVKLENDTWTPPGYPYEDDRYLLRPKNMEQFRALAHASQWPERWSKAADILEAAPAYWIYLSY